MRNQWHSNRQAIEAVFVRQAKRQQEAAAQREWLSNPQGQGAQQICRAIATAHTDVKREKTRDDVCRAHKLYTNQLHRWCKELESQVNAN